MFVVSHSGDLVNLDSVIDIFIWEDKVAENFGIFASIPHSNAPAPTFSPFPAPVPAPVLFGANKVFLAQYSDMEEAKSALEELVQAIEKGERIHRMR